jgi:hypothetical protein
MNKAIVVAAAVGAMMMSSAIAFAQQATPPAVQPQAQAPADDPNEMICRAGEPVTGSRFPGPRQCHTRKEWDQIRRDSQEALFHQQMMRACGGSGGAGSC